MENYYHKTLDYKNRFKLNYEKTNIRMDTCDTISRLIN